jgi:hypothetical protein
MIVVVRIGVVSKIGPFGRIHRFKERYFSFGIVDSRPGMGLVFQIRKIGNNNVMIRSVKVRVTSVTEEEIGN